MLKYDDVIMLLCMSGSRKYMYSLI